MNVANIRRQATDNTSNRNAAQQQRFGVTEVVLADGFGEHNVILLSILAHLTQTTENRWITWVGPLFFTRATLENAGINLKKLRIINTQSTEDTLWLFWEALANGNSGTVIAASNHCTETELLQLNRAAQTGQSQGIVVRQR